jgi:chemotaxis protein CheD
VLHAATAPPGPLGRDRGVPAAAGRRLVIGIGELTASDGAVDVIVTHALGSCIAVVMWDPVVHAGGMLHFLLPEARLNPARAAAQPGTFADTGIPLLYRTLQQLGAQRTRCTVRLVGGAEMSAGANGGAGFQIGKRNVLAAKNILWKAGLFVKAELVGGTDVRTVGFEVGTGMIRVTSGGAVIREM